MRRLVSGVLSSWLTVPTRFVFASSKKAELGHVLEDDRGSLEFRQLVADRQDAGQVMALLAPHPEGDDAGRSRSAGSARRIPARWPAARASAAGRPPAKSGSIANSSAAGLRTSNPPSLETHKERVRGGRQRGLHGALGLQDARQRGVPVVPQARGHRVERLGQAPELVARKLAEPGCRGRPSPSATADAVRALIGLSSDAARNQARSDGQPDRGPDRDRKDADRGVSPAPRRAIPSAARRRSRWPPAGRWRSTRGRGRLRSPGIPWASEEAPPASSCVASGREIREGGVERLDQLLRGACPAEVARLGHQLAREGGAARLEVPAGPDRVARRHEGARST